VSRHSARRGGTGDPLGPGTSTVDLHTHTVRSDGVLQPVELVRAAADAGVKTLAITDHDTLAGVRDLVLGRAMPAPIELIPGVEINAIARGIPLQDGELHILGLGMDLADEAFEAALSRQRASRRIRFERTVARLREIGLSIDAQIAMPRPHRGRCARPADDRAGADRRGLRDERRGRVPAADRLGRAAVRPARGHGPARCDRGDPGRRRRPGARPLLGGAAQVPLLRELAEIGLAGLEVFYISFDPGTVEVVGAVADELGLIGTGGSDYHGDTSTYADVHAILDVPDQVAAVVREAIGTASRTMPGR
jgi:predicted metal-dependent phosphoesterase TrpH